MILGGALIDGVGFRPTTLILAAGAQAIGLALLVVPALRELDAPALARTW